MIKKIKKHSFEILFIALIAVLSVFTISAQDNAGKIEISKTATKVSESFSNDNLEYGRLAKVNLNIKANPYNESTTTAGKLDIVLIFDSSNSMDTKTVTPNGASTRMKDAKQAANDFAETLMDNKETVKMGIVEFGTQVMSVQNMTTDKTTVKNFITSDLNLPTNENDGGTNLQAAIEKANSILKNGKREDAKQIVIILTDGVPTFFNYDGKRYGTGSSDSSVNYGCLDEGFFGCRKWTGSMSPSDAAKKELDNLKNENPTSDVYTIVFANDKTATDTLAKINPEQKTPLYKNYKALTAEELKKKFEEIIEESVGLIGKNSIVTDTIPADFKLTEGSKKDLQNQGIKITENSDGTTTLTWNVKNIEANKDYNLSYEVKADHSFHGSMYTNENATLQTTVSKDNPYYKPNTKLTLEFDKPAVEIPAITKDDHYSKNELYIGYSESTINGSSILNNDLNKNIKNDVATNNKYTTSTDEIKIVTNENTKQNQDGTYSIYKDNVLQGKLSMNEDGTFSFISEEGITGEVSFDYQIVTKINQNNETEYVISNKSTVTLNILERIKTEVAITKTWNDNNDQDGKRPSTITINLYADGKKIDTKEVTKQNNWTYTFTNLYKYQKGHENDQKYEIKYTVTENQVPNYKTEINGYNITNTHEIEKTQITGTKTWIDKNDQDGKRPDSITVKLYANGEYVSKTEATKDTNWTYTFTNLDKYKDGNEINYTVEEETVDGYTTSIDKNNNITNTHEIEKTQITGTKTWNDENNKDGLRPDYIKVNLLADGQIIDTKVVNQKTNWTYTFTNLDKYKEGKEITYTFEEQQVENYETTYDGTNITNTHVVKYVTIKGTKTWDDSNNKYGRPDTIKVNLLADGEKIDTKEVTKDTNWTYTFDNLPMYKEGKKITYTISEDKIQDYDTTINGYNITNTYNPETTQISGTKTWNDENNQDGIRPSSIEVELYANGEYITSKTVTATQNWKYEFTNLVKYANGNEINYTVKEKQITGYQITYDKNSYDITNTHTPEVIQKTVTKVWDDENNRDGLRPNSIKVILTADGKQIKETTLNETNNWTYTFNNLPKFNKGQVINYEVKEINIDSNYTSKITTNNNTFTITNTHEIEKTNLVVNKVWNDNNNQDGKRPTSLNVKIIGTVDNNKVLEENIVLNTTNNWKHTFDNLPVNYNGKKITYTAQEQMDSKTKENYTEEQQIIKDNIITLTNTHEIDKTQVNGKKSWVDSDDKDGLRPESIKIILKANGEEIDSKIINSSNQGQNTNEWLFSFTNLDKYKDGKEINYTVEEEVDSKTKEHYTKSYDDTNKYIIINQHNPKDVTVSGTKTWNDENNKYGRPNEITVNLVGKIGDETVIQKSTKVNESTNWTYSFEGLPEYSKGKLINYTISEDAVKDYNTEYDGYNIINTYNPETIKITGTKTWDDEDNQDGIRPEDITIVLYDHLNNEIATTKATKENNWTYTFDNLPKYANENEIKYTIKEVSVEGYETTIKDYNITNKHTPETISYKVTKVWNDNNNQDGLRPNSITVRLYKNGVEYKKATISASNNWTYTFENLPKYAKGQEITYEIVEDEVKGYTSEVKTNKEETNNKSGTITNTHKIIKKDIKITKTWIDNNNKTNKRPNKITVNILKNGNFFKQIILTKDMNWMFILKDLDKYQDGKEIIYQIQELKVKNYITKYNGYNIINTLNYKEKPNKIIPVIKQNTEITPPSTGIENNNINLLESITITILILGTIITPIRLIKNN